MGFILLNLYVSVYCCFRSLFDLCPLAFGLCTVCPSFFELRIMITLLVSSNISFTYSFYYHIVYVCCVCVCVLCMCMCVVYVCCVCVLCMCVEYVCCVCVLRVSPWAPCLTFPLNCSDIDLFVIFILLSLQVVNGN